MKSLLRLAATDVHFKCNKIWYTQSDGLAMGASLAGILSNLWMKSFEKSLQKPKEGRAIKTPDTNVICIDCNRRVIFRGKGVECKNWFHAKCHGITDTEYKTMQEIVWICSYCAEEGRKEDTLELKLFEMYVDDIVCTVKGKPLDFLEYANTLHKNLQITRETPNGSGDLAFLDLNINLNEDRKISCHWYQKSTDTCIILNFRSCAPLQHKRNVIQGTVHRIFNATSDWQSFDVALKKLHLKKLFDQEIWTENQYPMEWSSSFVNETLDKIVTKEKVTAKPPQNEQNLKKLKVLLKGSLNLEFLFNTEEISREVFASRLKKLCDIKIIFTTRKLRTCLPTLKSPFDKNLKSHVVYKVTCNGCNSIYVGQNSQHITTRFSEHQKKDSPVGQHFVEYCGTTHNVKWENLDSCREVEKLMTIEAIYIKKLRPQINTRDEYRGRELKLKY